MKTTATSFMSLWCATILSGCATMMSGNFQEVSFDSNPRGAEIFMEGNKLGVTPFSTSLPRALAITNDKNGKAVATPPLVLVGRKEGYEEQNISLPVGLNPWMWVDVILSTGLVGTTSMGVDTGTPAQTQYEPDKYFVTLTPLKASQMERVRLAKTIRLRNFVLLSYTDLQSDWARGRGEYLGSLNKLLGSAEGNADTTLTELRRLSLRHATVSGFAEAVVERLYGWKESY